MNIIKIKKDNITFEIIKSIYDIFTISIDNTKNYIEIELDLNDFKELYKDIIDLLIP